MTEWNPAEVDQLARTKEIQITSPRADGTPREPVTIWVVGLDGELYIRSVRGAAGAWFQGTENDGSGQVEGGGVDRAVGFAAADHDLDDEIDAAYREKYSDSPDAVESITSEEARATTLRLLPA
jgi:hypothetical protein